MIYFLHNSPKHLRSLSVENQHYTHKRDYFCCSLGQSSRLSFLSLHTPLASLLYFGARGLFSERQSETLRCPRAHFPNSQIINWKSRGNVIQFFSSLNRLHISSSQEAQRLGHFKAQPCALVRQLARRRISFSRLTFAVKGSVYIVRACNRFIKSCVVWIKRFSSRLGWPLNGANFWDTSYVLLRLPSGVVT